MTIIALNQLMVSLMEIQETGGQFVKGHYIAVMFHKQKAFYFSSCTLPQNSIYDLEWDVYLNYFRIISAVNRNNHFVTQVSLEVELSLKYTQMIHFLSLSV